MTAYAETAAKLHTQLHIHLKLHCIKTESLSEEWLNTRGQVQDMIDTIQRETEATLRIKCPAFIHCQAFLLIYTLSI